MTTNNTFLSPGFFGREIDQSAQAPAGPVGVPAGVIGTANRGPAFVPVTVGDFNSFIATFGNLDSQKFGPYAAYYFLANRSALTYMRVLGAGANTTGTDINRTTATGRAKNAGVHLDGTLAVNDNNGRHNGVVQFLAAVHTLQANEAFGPAIFTENSSFSGNTVRLVRGMIMTPTTARIMVADGQTDFSQPGRINALVDHGTLQGTDSAGNSYFKLIISSTLGAAFYNDDGNPGCHILTASLNPDDVNYYAKLINTNPDLFVSGQCYLYADFPVDNQIATPTVVGILSGTTNSSTNNPDSVFTSAPYNDNTTFRAAYGALDARYQTPVTPNIISQPFGPVEYDLFAVQALDDGQYANNLFKISIINIQASIDPTNPFGTFGLQVRAWNDTDTNPNVLEQFNNLSLNPNAANYIAAVIGDRHVTFNFDATTTDDRRIVTSGRYPNQSKYIRVVMQDQVNKGLVPQNCLPFGTRGHNLLKTNDSLTDSAQAGNTVRIAGVLTGSSAMALSGAILPPVPFRSKVTKGARSTSGWFGLPGPAELASPLYYWGVQFERLDIPLNPNLETVPNPLLSSYTQFLGIQNLDQLVTGSGADTFNNNKFTLSKVAFSNDYGDVYGGTAGLSGMTASIDTAMREAAYIRNATLDGAVYTYQDPTEKNGSNTASKRVTLATLLAKGTAQQFNRFAPYLKFSTFMAGGWDGVNPLDSDARRMNDYSTSFVGEALAGFTAPGFTIAQNGTGQTNNNVASYVAAVNIMTDPLQVNHNVLAIPGIREPFITDYTSQQVKQYGLAYYVMDIEKFDENGNRLFDTSTVSPDVGQTASGFSTRAYDNNYVGTYFPDVIVTDANTNRRVKVPSSVAAMGALAFNDRVGYPWFAPAGFNRASLDFVNNVEVRLSSADKDLLYTSARINPIASFPRLGFVIFGQKTLQQKSSALDRVNVRRLLLEVKRIIINVANALEFEQNTPAVWNTFVSQATLQLGLIQAQAGIEAFQVIMNETNNSSTDIAQNKLNGKIVVVPTRVIEFIAIDFIITNSGVQFV